MGGMSDVQPSESAGADPNLRSGRAVVIGLGLLFVVMLAATLILAAVMPGVVARQQRANRVKCSNTLRGLGVAALQYSQDGGRFPHVMKRDELDGDPTTPDTPKAWRMLLRGGYVDVPEAFVCPVKPKHISPPSRRVERRTWLTTPSGERSPSASPSLEAFERLSYGWTRRGLGAEARGSYYLAADKAVFAPEGEEQGMRGNHVDGWTVLRVDGSTTWLSVHDEPFPGATLHRIEDPERDGFLSVKNQSDPSLLR
jgi:hypothetical protein